MLNFRCCGAIACPHSASAISRSISAADRNETCDPARCLLQPAQPAADGRCTSAIWLQQGPGWQAVCHCFPRLFSHRWIKTQPGYDISRRQDPACAGGGSPQKASIWTPHAPWCVSKTQRVASICRASDLARFFAAKQHHDRVLGQPAHARFHAGSCHGCAPLRHAAHNGATAKFGDSYSHTDRHDGVHDRG